MADKNQINAADKTDQAITGGDKATPEAQAKATAPEKPLGPQAPEDKAPAPPAGGKTISLF